MRESLNGEAPRGGAVPLWRSVLGAVGGWFARRRGIRARLAESERRLKAAAESIPDGLAIFDRDDRLAFFNSRYPEHLTANLRATLALGKRWSDWSREALALGPIYHPDMGADYLAERDDDRRRPYVDREHRLIDGRWVRARETGMPDGGRVLLTTDVTAERERKEQQMLLATATAHAGDSVEIAGPDYRLGYVNPAFTRLTGWSAEEAIGRTPAELLRSGHHEPAFFDAIEEAMNAGRVWTGRIVSRHKDGHLLHQDATISPVPDERGRLAHAVAVKRDVTDRIEAEAALRASEARFLAAAESIPDGLVILDAEDRVVFYNSRHPELLPPALREVLRPGIRFEEWIREGLARGPVYHPDMGADYPDRRLAARGQERTEREHKHADGRWVRIREAAMPDGGRVLLTTDITARREAEERSWASEARFLAAAESIPDGLAIFDAEDRLVHHNSRYPEHLTENLRPGLRLGVRFTEWIAQGLAQGPIYHPDMGEDFPSRRFAMRGEERTEHEHKLVDGRWMRVRESRMADGGRVLLTTDVTERRRRERQLTLLAKAVEQVGDAVEITDAEGRFTYVNPAFVAVTGFEAAEVIGRRPQDVLHSGRHEASFFVALQEQLAQDDGWQGRIVNRRKDGELIHQDTTISPLRDAAGQITHYVAVKRDVTEQEKAEAALRASEARYRAIVEDQTEFISRFTPDFTLTFVNRAYTAQLGRAAEALVGTSLLDLMTEVQRAQFTAQLARLTPEAPTVSYETDTVLPDGTQGWEHWTDRALFDAAGRVVEYQSVGRDVTEARRAEAALRDSEARYRAVVEGQSEFIIRLRPNGTLTFVNEAYCRYRGLAREVLLAGFNDVYHYPPEQQARIHAAWAALTPDAPSVTYELVEPCAGGGQRWEEWTDTAVFAPNGKVVEYQAIGRDVTERKRAEQALRESEARFRMIAEGVPLPIAITAADERRILFVNAKAREVFGLEEGSAAVETVWEDARRREAVYGDILETGSVEQVEVRMRRADGTLFDALLSARPIRHGGRPAVLGVVTDITDLRRMEQELRASEQRFRTIAEIHPAPMVVTRLDDRRVLFANRAFFEAFRLTPEQLQSFDRTRLYPQARERDEIYAAIDRGERVDNREMLMRTADGVEFPAVLAARGISYEGTRCCVMSFLDVTERKAAEAEIQRQREALHQGEKLTALGSLLAGVAHELNNPLSVVIGYASLLKELAPDDANRQRAERVHAAAERCARIVKTFLAMARSRPPQHGPVAVNEVVEDALELAGYGLRTADIEIVRELEPDLPRVWGDSDQLHQVLTNLIVNAQQALLQAAAPRRLQLRTRRQGNEAVAIEVADSGPGMSEEVRKRIFDPFFTTKPQGMGTGIGLSVSHGIVTAHEGRIAVESRLGEGTRFTLTLPRRADMMATPGATPSSPAPPPAAARVLVIDDEQEIAELVAEHLRRDGLTVEVVSSGRLALARLGSEKFDLIVSDLRMPDMDGPALIQALRRRSPELARRILLITGDALGAELNDVVREANLPVLEKPLDLADLRAQVRRLLEAA
jgi:PAS domain S-box-containing protein